jgi:hypothetical protein
MAAMTAPIAQRDLFTRRWRGVRQRDLEPKEHLLQISLVDRLNWQCRKDVVYFHCPNGELRDKATAAKLKAMGVRPGVADLIFIWGELVAVPNLLILPRVLFLELKRRGEKQSPVQKLFEAECKRVGCDYAVADNIDDAVSILQHFNILPRPKSEQQSEATHHDQRIRTAARSCASSADSQVFPRPRQTPINRG